MRGVTGRALAWAEERGFTIYCVFLVLFSLLPYPLARLGGPRPAPAAEAKTAAPSHDADEEGEADRVAAVSRNEAPADRGVVLLEDIVQGHYALRSDVATGRFLREFEHSIQDLFDVRISELRPVRRTPGWLQLEAPHIPDHGLENGGPRSAVIRLVKVDGTWKLEHVRITRRAFDDA